MANEVIPVVVMEVPEPIVMRVDAPENTTFSVQEQSVRVENNYNRLDNKPTINGRTIIGNQTVAYYLQDGLIINGGDATGVT